MPPMLKYVRTHQKRIFLILAVAIIIPFAFWGVLSDTEDRAPTTLGQLDGRKVSVTEYLRSYRAVRDQGIMAYGDEFARLAKDEDLRAQAWDRILFLEEAKRRGLKTADSEVVGWLLSQEIFSRGGAFDERSYQNFVREYLRNEPRQFEEQIREALTIEKLRREVESKVELTEEDLKAAYARESAKREILVLIAPPDPSKVRPVADKDVEAIYPLVKNQFTAPRRVKVAYIQVPAGDKRTDEIAADVSSLEEAAKKFSLQAHTTDFFSENEALPDFAYAPEALFASFEQNPGQESAWLKTEDGLYKVKTLEREAERPLSIEEAHGELRRLLEREAVARTAFEKLTPLKDKIASQGIEAAGKEAGLEIRRIENYKAGRPVAGIGDDPAFARQVALLKDGETGEPFLAGAGAAIVKVVKTQTAGDDKEFAKISDDLKKKLSREKASAELQKMAERLRGRLELNPDAVKKVFGPQGGESK